MYSLALNRRYSAYILSGTAMRSAIVMGLHLNIPDAQLPDFGAREHRKQLFWTAYMFDRMWGASLGHPSAIQDDEIEVDFPSTLPFSGATGGDQLPSDDFDCQYHVASIELVRHLANVVRSIYSLRRQNQDAQLSMRVHQSLQDLHAWMYRLPPRLQIDHSPGAANHWKVVSLHLSFYQVSISISPHCHCPCLAPGFTYNLAVRYHCHPSNTTACVASSGCYIAGKFNSLVVSGTHDSICAVGSVRAMCPTLCAAPNSILD